MATYEYRREDGTIFEANQSMKDDALEVCPTTGQKVTRIISGGTGLIFKGTGFYLTDYARKNTSGADRDAESKANDGKDVHSGKDSSANDSSGKDKSAKESAATENSGKGDAKSSSSEKSSPGKSSPGSGPAKPE